MKIGAAMFFTDYSMAPGELGRALEERGFIRRLPNRARAIEVIKLPDSVQHGMSAGRARGFTPKEKLRGAPVLP